ncbi:hypothetical protein [Sphingomonas sp. VDB2]
MQSNGVIHMVDTILTP